MSADKYVYRPEPKHSHSVATELLNRKATNRIVNSWPEVTQESSDRVARDLAASGTPVEELPASPEDYARYMGQAEYPVRYPNYYTGNLPEKSFEHFLACRLLELQAPDTFVDIASEGSALPDIVSRLAGASAYAQDIMYQPGMNGRLIGGDACAMPVPAGFATAAALTCSLEHFEGDGDTRLFHELARVLKPGGRVCVVPLYMFPEPIAMTDPVYSADVEVPFDPEATVYSSQGWGNRHGRYYSPGSLRARILEPAAGKFRFRIFRIRNVAAIHSTIYAHFALLAERV